MIKREAEEKLKQLADGFPAVSVTGPRQSGKTTLVKAVFTSNSRAKSTTPVLSERLIIALFFIIRSLKLI
ncbi:MAG: hypothetical protein PHP13_04345 [Methanomicrobium sp.]|nr:hypothetical protein [Methanomicrobium sp.]